MRWNGNPVPIAALDAKCTQGNEHFRIAAHVRNGGVTGAPLWLDEKKQPHFELAITEGSFLELRANNAPEVDSTVTVFLDGVVLASSSACQNCTTTVPPEMPTLCRQPEDTGSLGEKGVCYSSAETYQDAMAKCPVIGEATEDRFAGQRGMDGCNVTKSRVLIDSTVTGPVLQPKNIVVMGNDISTRTCALRGVANFTRVNGDWVAQIDPNTRDPKVKSPLCFPLNSMIFSAGVVDREGGPIIKAAAIQIEPHGSIRVITQVGPSNGVLHLQLDGIAYHPLMMAPKPPAPNCAPYCFPAKPLSNSKMSPGTSCVKYCTPEQLNATVSPRVPLACKCDMLKRIDCWEHDTGNSDTRSGIRCGQYKQLLATRHADMNANETWIQQTCAAICARQLSAF